MKRRLLSTARLSFPLAMAIASLLAVKSSYATTLYWDGTDTNVNANGGAGTWNTSSTNWDTLPLAGANSVWTNATPDSAVFGGTASTSVALGSNIDIANLRFNTTGYGITTTGFALNFAAGSNTILFDKIAAASITGPIGGTGSVTLSAITPATPGILTLNGTSAGGWSGATTINNGMTLALAAGNQGLASTTGGITLNGGGISVTSADTDAEDDLDRISTAAITSNGGTITYTTTTAASTRNFIETIGSVTLTTGQFNLVNTLDKSAGSQTLALSGLTQAGTSAITFSNAGGLNTTTDRIRVNSIATDTTPGTIIGPWATVGTTAALQTDYSIYDSDGANGYVVGAGIAATAASTWSATHAATSNYTLTNASGSAVNGKLSGTLNINSLRNTTAVGGAISVDAGTDVVTQVGSTYSNGDVVVLGSSAGGLTAGVPYYVRDPSGGPTFKLAATSGGTAIDITAANTGTLTPGITLGANNLGTFGILNGSAAVLAIGASGTGAVTLPTTAAGNLHVNAGSGAIAINAPINDNTATGVLTLVKNGAGTLFLSGTNGYTGPTIINAGTINYTNYNTNATSSITVNPGGTLQTPAAAGTFNRNMILNGGTLAPTPSSANTIQSGTINVAADSIISYAQSNLTTSTISGAMTGAGGLTKIGTGHVKFTNSSIAYSGPTVVTAGFLQVQDSLYANNSSNWTPANITVTSGGALVLNVGGASDFSTTEANTLFGNISTNVNNNGLLAGSTIGLDPSNAAGDVTFSSVIGDSTGLGGGSVNFRTGSGTTSGTLRTLILGNANTYSGKTTIAIIGFQTIGASLSISSFNSVNGGTPLMASSSLGAPTTVTNGTIDIGQANSSNPHTLTYTGTGETTDRVINTIIGANGTVTINQAGSGLLKFTSAFTRGTATSHFALGGAGNGEIAAALPAFTNLTKANGGTWTLSGNNAYTGITTVSGGTLIARHANALGTGGTRNVTVAAGATLNYAATANAPLSITGTLGITGGTNTAIGGSIGSTLTGAQIAVTGTAIISNAAHRVNIYGVNGITTGTTGTYTLITGNVTGSILNPATAPTLGTVYNNTNFIIDTTVGVGGFVRTANTLGVAITNAPSTLTSAYWTGNLPGATNVWAASNGTTTSNWSTDLGGTATGLIPGAGADVFISATTPLLAATATVLGADMSIRSLTINAASGLGVSADPYTLTIANAAGITMSNTVTANSSIAANVSLGASQTWTNDSANDLTVSGVISGATFGITKAGSGAGRVILAGLNTYSGNTTVSTGILEASGYLYGPDGTSTATVTVASGAELIASGTSNNAVGQGGSATWIVAGTLNSTGGGAQTLPNTVALNNGTITGIVPTTVGSAQLGTLYASTSRTITANGTTNTLSAANIGMAISSTILTLATPLATDALAVSSVIGVTGRLSGGVTKTGLGTVTLTGANIYTGTTSVTAGTLKLNRTAADNTTIATDGNTATTSDILINGGTLEIAASEQIANTGSINMTSGAFNFGAATGKTETIDKFTNSGGTFSTGANTLIGLGATITWSGGTNTVNNGGTVKDKHVVITGGTNTVEAGGTLELQNGNGTSGLIFGNTSSPTLTLNSVASGSAGKLLLKQDVTVDNTLTSGTAQILNGGALAVSGSIDMDGGTRTFTINNGNSATDMLVSAVITNGALTKEGAGTLALSATGSYTGATTVTAGKLLMGDAPADTFATTAVTVASTATLGGSGVIAGTLDITGNLAPGGAGVDIKTLAAGTTTWNGGSNLWNFDLSTGAGSSDRLAITGDFTKGTAGAYKFDFMSSAPATWGNTYTLVTWDTATTFAATDFSFQGLSGAYTDGTFAFSGKSLVFTAVPEPTSALVGLLIGAGLLRRRRHGYDGQGRRRTVASVGDRR